MLHPSTELRTINPTIGAGVFASEPIPRGTIVWIRDPLDHVFSPEEFDALEGPIREHALKYSFVDGQGSSILCWDLAKYVNHSCEANLLSTPFEFEIAVRDIAAGEQITEGVRGPPTLVVVPLNKFGRNRSHAWIAPPQSERMLFSDHENANLIRASRRFRFPGAGPRSRSIVAPSTLSARGGSQ